MDAMFETDAEAAAFARGAGSRGKRPTAEPVGPAFWTDQDDSWDEADIPQRPWIVQGFLMRGVVSLLVGSAGAGKSTIALCWAISLALGRSHGRFENSVRRRVMVLNCEDDKDEQRRRTSALIQQFGSKPSDLGGHLLRVGPENIGALFERDEATGELIKTAGFDQLVHLIDDTAAEVAILDPVIELTTGVDENSNSDMKLVLSHLRSLAIKKKIAILLVHHVRKGMVTPGDLDSARGASAIGGAIRGGMTLVGMSEEEATTLGIPVDQRKHYLRLDDAKQSYSAISDASWYERLGILLGNGDAAPTLIPWSIPKDVITADGRAAVEAGITRGSPAGPWSPQLTSDARSIRRLMSDHGITTTIGQKQLLASLEAAGFNRARYYRTSHSDWPTGLRSPEGLPDTVRWESEEEAQARAVKAKSR